jgi:integral membrane sensor domain MASE1
MNHVNPNMQNRMTRVSQTIIMYFAFLNCILCIRTHRAFTQFHGSSIPIFHLADLAYTKLIIHALKHAPKTVNGVLLGRISVSDASIAIVDAVPLQHDWLLDLSSYADVGLNMVSSTLPYPLLY